MNGNKDILGLWVSETESASFWTSVCNDLKNRGVCDILIACHDNLKELSTAVNVVFPKTEQQLCIIHQVRNSTKYVSYKDLKPVTTDLKAVYNAATVDEAEYKLEEFREKWDKKYPQIIKSWNDNWAELSTFFKYPEELRKIIYTTNAVEGLHRMLRKLTKNKVIYPADDALKKSVYLSVKEITKKWSQPIHNWGQIVGQFIIFFDDRLSNKSVS
jgi:putative transposase